MMAGAPEDVLDDLGYTVRLNGVRRPERRFPLVPFDQIQLTKDRPYLVKGILPREGLAVVWGPPKCGKSFLVLDVAMAVARGVEWRGRRVAQGPVVYIACEGERGLAARIEAYRRDRLVASHSPPFWLLTTRLDLAQDAAALVADIRAQIGDEGCALVVIDTLNRSLGGSESSDEDMAAYIKGADLIREAFGCAVTIIHHCGVDDRRPRGHTSLAGAVDAQIAVRRDEAGGIAATVELLKDGEAGAEVRSTLRVVELGFDEDGEPLTSCVVDPAEAAPETAKPRMKKLPDAARVGLEQLRNCLADHAEPIPPSKHVPQGARGVTLEHWRSYLLKAGVINAEGNPREQFRRIRVTLQTRGVIGVWDNFVWVSHAVT